MKWLQNFLKDQTLPFYSYIVFSERCSLKKITLTSGKHHVIKRDQLLAAVRQNASSAGTQLTPQKIDMLYKKLYPFTQADAAKKAMHIENIRKKH